VHSEGVLDRIVASKHMPSHDRDTALKRSPQEGKCQEVKKRLAFQVAFTTMFSQPDDEDRLLGPT